MSNVHERKIGGGLFSKYLVLFLVLGSKIRQYRLCSTSHHTQVLALPRPRAWSSQCDGGPRRACGQFVSFSRNLDYQLHSKSIMQVDKGSVPPPRSIIWRVTPYFLRFGSFSIGVQKYFTRNSTWRRPAGVGLVSLNPPVVFKIDYHVQCAQEKVRGGAFSTNIW